MDPKLLPMKELVNNLDIDKEMVEIFAIIGGTVIAAAVERRSAADIHLL